MKKRMFLPLFLITLISGVVKAGEIEAAIDLVNVKDDMVKVILDPGKFKTNTVKFNMPQTIPGTYQNSNFGKFIEDFKAFDKKGNELEFVKNGNNTWVIENGKKLDKVTYWVNDTFDSENAKGIYPMEGTSNIAGEVFYLNLHGYIGYFDEDTSSSYTVTIDSPADLKPYTTLESVSKSATKDVFKAERYFLITDNPIMYVNSDAVSFNLGDISVNFAVYSPSGNHKASDYEEAMKKMMRGQKAFLGDANTTKQYDILLYLATDEEIQNFGGVLGALEHHTSTTVVFNDGASKEGLEESLIDTVSHEFFHTLTPLSVHSEEIHNFDYNNPKLSKHLWMYEGNTEYFANLFQINQGLISEDDFYQRMTDKIINSKERYNDTLSFTLMSENAADKPYSDEYGNVYQKGALINMCVDIIMREQSNGEKGVLWMMKQLANKYGVDKPFKDKDLFDDISAITYPEVDEFLNKYVIEGGVIPYDYYFKKVGLGPAKVESPLPSILMGSPSAPFVTPNPPQGLLLASSLNSSLEALGMKDGDAILAINDLDLTDIFTNPAKGGEINTLFQKSFEWSEDTDVRFKVKRGAEELELKGKVGKPAITLDGFGADPSATPAQVKLRSAWLKG